MEKWGFSFVRWLFGCWEATYLAFILFRVLRPFWCRVEIRVAEGFKYPVDGVRVSAEKGRIIRLGAFPFFRCAQLLRFRNALEYRVGCVLDCLLDFYRYQNARFQQLSGLLGRTTRFC